MEALEILHRITSFIIGAIFIIAPFLILILNIPYILQLAGKVFGYAKQEVEKGYEQTQKQTDNPTLNKLK